MKRQRWFLLGLIVVLVFSWAPGAVAYSNISIWNLGYSYMWERGIHAPRNVHIDVGGFMGWVDLTTPEIGLFSQDVIFTPRIDAFYSTFDMLGSGVVPFPNPFTGIVEISTDYGWLPITTRIDLDILLDQSGPTRFTNLNWEVKQIDSGSETTILSGCADADLIANGGSRFGSVYMDHGPIFIPVEYTCSNQDPWGNINPDRFYFYGEGNISFNETFIFSVTGNVVPIPSALFLFGSGLIPLALYGKGKLFRRS